MKKVGSIVVRDKDLVRKVESEKARRGDKCVSKTAQRLMTERLAQLELISQQSRPALAA